MPLNQYLPEIGRMAIQKHILQVVEISGVIIISIFLEPVLIERFKPIYKSGIALWFRMFELCNIGTERKLWA